MIVLVVLQCVLTFGLLVFGLGLPIVVRLPLRTDEKLGLAPAAGLIVIYLAAFAIYALDVPSWCFLILPAAALTGVIARRAVIRDLLRDPETRRLLAAVAIWAGWVLGFLALVRSYFGVGAGATGDWVEHFQRAEFFLGHWPLDYRFIWLYPLPARPPLANLATGAFLALTQRDFVCFQAFAALESSLVFLPGWLLCRRFNAAPSAVRVFLLVCMANPLLLHNATYPWTKLITAYFVLCGAYLFLEGLDRRQRGYFAACFLLLSAGLLAHYSAGPYGVVLAAIYLLAHRRQWFHRAFLASTGRLIVVSLLLLATWFGWSWRHYGWRETVASNTAVTATHASSLGDFAEQKLGNLVSSLVPRPLRDTAGGPGELFSPLATLDQVGYQFYQLTLPFAFGVTGFVFLIWRLGRSLRRSAEAPPTASVRRRFWLGFVPAVILVGVVVNGAYDRYGVAHICLQPLVVLGLAFLAAEVPRLSGRLRRIFWAGVTLDFLYGVALHFAAEHAGAALLRPGSPLLAGGRIAHHALPATWTVVWLSNLLAKFYFGLSFIGDHSPPTWTLVAFLGCLLVLVLRLRPARTGTAP